MKALSEEAERNLVEIGLSDPGVLDAYLRDPGTELEVLAREPGDVVKLVEVWALAKRAARGQRAEFARRGLDQFARWDKARKAEARAHEEQGPNELQRAAEVPPPWHCRRLQSRLARSTRETAEPREKAEEEERQRWVAEVTELLLTLSGMPTTDKAARTADPRLSAARMCSKVRASTIRSYVRAWRPLWLWWTGTGKQGLPSSGEVVLTYLEQRAAEPCAPSVLTRTRSALAFYEEAAGLPLSQRVSKCPWFCRQADALQSTLYLAAAEVMVVDTQEKSVLRCYAFWRCLECWGALRFSDHRGLSPTDCSLTDTAFKGMLTRTETTGRDKKVLNRVLHVDRGCWLLKPDWLEVGWTLRQKGDFSCQYQRKRLNTGRSTSVVTRKQQCSLKC